MRCNRCVEWTAEYSLAVEYGWIHLCPLCLTEDEKARIRAGEGEV